MIPIRTGANEKVNEDMTHEQEPALKMMKEAANEVIKEDERSQDEEDNVGDDEEFEKGLTPVTSKLEFESSSSIDHMPRYVRIYYEPIRF